LSRLSPGEATPGIRGTRWCVATLDDNNGQGGQRLTAGVGLGEKDAR
jgi:hypothetical protein